MSRSDPNLEHRPGGDLRSGVHPDDAELLRAIHDELEPAEVEALERRMREDARLAARHRQLSETWRELELPPPPTIHSLRPELAQRLLAVTSRPQLPPVWRHAASAAVVVLGMAIGLGLGSPGDPLSLAGGTASAPQAPVSPDPRLEGAVEPVEEGDDAPWQVSLGASLAEAYWRAVEETGGRLGEIEDPGPKPRAGSGGGAES